ncbi:MAG TPA: hypothetical protein VJN43_00780 [Bryobacteraceae bacterium]|nr:hypothetical protein [Bryobacteraceae bacterium]
MPCQIETNLEHNGLHIARFENELVSVDVLPQLGAKIYSFVHKASGVNLLWHNPRLAPAPVHYGAKFDDNWSGGWDELVPNDNPCPFPNGDVLPDHGEVWSQATAWQIVKQSEDAVAVRFVSYGRVLPTRFEKELSLRSGESMLRVRYTYENQGPKPVHFVWNVHPALAISAATRLDVPAHDALVAEWMNDQFEPLRRYQWPYAIDRAGEQIDMRVVPPASAAVADAHYFLNVREGWYAVTDTEKRVGFGLVFPTSVFPHVWLFRTAGGWRGLNTLILEASNGCSSNLWKGVETGQCGVLAPGESVHADVFAVAYAGCTGVERIHPDGRIVPRQNQS